jgi:hypothetical protein
MREFKVNDHITLKLEIHRSNFSVYLYVKEERFMALNPSDFDTRYFSESRDMDEAVERAGEEFDIIDHMIGDVEGLTYNEAYHEIHGVYPDNKRRTHEKQSEFEFDNICSQFVKWRDSGYNAKYMVNSIHIPLIKKFVQ